MFKNSFPVSESVKQQPQYQPPQQPQTQAQPVSQVGNNPNHMPRVYNGEDPMVAKIKKWLLIGLTALIAGSATILIIWRVILKF